MKLRLKRLAHRFGVEVSRHRAPLDLSHASDVHPMEAAYRAEYRPVLLKVPLEKCLTFGLSAFVPTVEGISPFVHALREWHSNRSTSYDDSHLKTFYDWYQPATAADLYGIEDGANQVLCTMPPVAAPLPWRAQRPADLVSLYEAQIAAANREHGTKLSAADGNTFFGPISRRKGTLEYARLTGVYESIRTTGFTVDRSGLANIRVVALVDGDGETWRWMAVSSGQHRLAALGALGYEEAIVQFKTSEGLGGVVLKEHCAQFPLVHEGVASVLEMHRLFDRLLSGRSPPCASAWARQLASGRVDE